MPASARDALRISLTKRSLFGVIGAVNFLGLLLTKFFPLRIYPETGAAVPVKLPKIPLIIVAIKDDLEVMNACLLSTSCFLFNNNVFYAHLFQLLFAS